MKRSEITQEMTSVQRIPRSSTALLGLHILLLLDMLHRARGILSELSPPYVLDFLIFPQTTFPYELLDLQTHDKHERSHNFLKERSLIRLQRKRKLQLTISFRCSILASMSLIADKSCSLTFPVGRTISLSLLVYNSSDISKKLDNLMGFETQSKQIYMRVLTSLQIWY